MTKELIIAAYDRNLDWVSSLNSDVKQTIYRKGVKGSENEIFIEPNLGRCVHTFFNHIYLNYDNLSDITLFGQDYPFDHWGNIIEAANGGIDFCDKNASLIIGGYYGFHNNTLNTAWKMHPSTHHESGEIIHCNSLGEPQAKLGTYNINMDKIWGEFFTQSHPNRYEFMPGGHFAITKEHVKIRSKAFYKSIVDYLINDIDSPWIVERLECYIFNPKYKTKL
jgi:hypothetical protein